MSYTLLLVDERHRDLSRHNGWIRDVASGGS